MTLICRFIEIAACRIARGRRHVYVFTQTYAEIISVYFTKSRDADYYALRHATIDAAAEAQHAPCYAIFFDAPPLIFTKARLSCASACCRDARASNILPFLPLMLPRAPWACSQKSRPPAPARLFEDFVARMPRRAADIFLRRAAMICHASRAFSPQCRHLFSRHAFASHAYMPLSALACHV